ncbi:hypothetical protein DV872_22575 [Oceanispirochaeta sp. M1]|nr:hypothetical protein DV872_22575 [Oceanispirochaeta sp. M1]
MIILTSRQMDDLLKALDSKNNLVFNFYRIRCRLWGILQRPSLSKRERAESEAFINFLCKPPKKTHTDSKIYPCLETEDEAN